ncbi:MAG: dolichol kinase [Ignavibacteria bacterium]|nr:dolichol kinase [Ignavibacteria bacterium]
MSHQNVRSISGEIDFKKELVRKFIHLISLTIPISYWFWFSKETTLFLLIILAVISLAIDIARLYHTSFSQFYNIIFQSILREHETTDKKKNLTGATYVLISAVLCVALFPKLIAITSFFILIISDTASALFGRKFGRHKFNSIAGGKKSWEGSIAFVISAFAVILLTPKVRYSFVEYAYAFIAAIGGAIAELFSFDFLDDNLAIPLTIGFLLWGMYQVFLPEFPINSF